MSVLNPRLKYQTRSADYEPGQRNVSPSMLVVAGLLAFSLVAVFKTGNDIGRANGASVEVGGAEGPTTETVVEKGLSSPMAAALESVAQRYRVAPEALQPVFLAAQQAGKDLDPLLIIAIIGIESGFNPYAQSVMGAQGLMQVIPRFHRDKLSPETAPGGFLDPTNNVRIGARILQDAIRRQGGLIEGLQYYAGASDDPDRAYASRVIAEKQRLEQAVRARRVPPAPSGQRPPPARDATPKME